MMDWFLEMYVWAISTDIFEEEETPKEKPEEVIWSGS